jgi:CRP-like cAMP-binding protein
MYLVLPQKFHIDELASIGVHARAQEYNPGEVLVHQGHESTELFIVSDGYVDVTISQASAATQYIRTLGRGAVMGEAALFSKVPRTANILAKSRVVAFIIHCDDLIDELSPQRLEQLKTKLGFQFTKWKLVQADRVDAVVNNRVRPHKMSRRGSCGSDLRRSEGASHDDGSFHGRVVKDEMLSYQKQGKNRRRETPLRRRRSLVSEVATTIYTSTMMEDLRRIYKCDEGDDAEDNYFTSDTALLMRSVPLVLTLLPLGLLPLP